MDESCEIETKQAGCELCVSELPTLNSTRTTPSCTRTGKVLTHSRFSAWFVTLPVTRSIFQACKGQTTVLPETIPSASGPPRCGQRFATPLAQALLHTQRCVHGVPSHFFDRDTLHEIVSSFEIVGVFAVVLKEKCRGLERLFHGFNGDQQVSFANFLPGRASDHDLPRAVLANETDVFHRRFRAISRTAHRTHFYFVWRVEMLEAPLEFNPSARGILHSEAAEVRTDTGLHHAHTLCVRLARRHAEIGPNFWQVRFLDTEEIDALASGDLHHGHVVFFRDVRDAPKLFRRGHTAPHARYDGKRSVFLNVGVHAIVDEACRAVFVVITAPQHVHHIAQRRLADFAAVAVAVNIENFLHGTEPLAAHDIAQLILGERNALAQNFLRRFPKFRHHSFE